MEEEGEGGKERRKQEKRNNGEGGGAIVPEGTEGTKGCLWIENNMARPKMEG